jgi:4-hydroxybenzoate polyprenyltransferase
MLPLIKLMRPHQWLKNGFVLAGLLFGHAWGDPVKLSQAMFAFAAFCMLASAVYVMNDIIDREQDRVHPKKRMRPLAAGTVSLPVAVALMVICLVTAAVLVTVGGSQTPWLFVSYFVINVAYSFGLKHVVILDVFLISAGFMLRIFVGTIGIGIMPSNWLLLCGLLLTLFLGFAKRRAELEALDEGSADHRRVLDDYTVSLLDHFISIVAAGTLVSYALYTMSGETVAMHGTRQLVLTIPFVLYGMLRYLWRLHRRGGGGDPAQELLTDPHMLVATLGWIVAVLAILSGKL